MFKNFMRNTAVALAFLATATTAFAGSTIDPTVPAQNSPMASAPIRNNFQAAYNDINNLTSKYASPFAPTNPTRFQEWINTGSSPYAWEVWDGTQWVITAYIDASLHLAGTVPPSATLNGGVKSSGAVSNQFLTAINTDGTVSRAQVSCTGLSGVGTACGKNTGTSVADPGTGALEALLPIQTQTGASYTFAAADLQKETRRSNSGSAMTDTFPDSTALGLQAQGPRITVSNNDATASDTITAGAGTAFASGSTDVVEAGRSVSYSYDQNGGSPLWRKIYNSGSGAIFGSTGSNVSGDVVSMASAYGKVQDSGIAAAQVVISAAGLTNGALAIGTTNPQAITSLARGNTVTVLHGNASGVPAFGSVALGTDVSGTLPLGSGGTNNAALTASNGGIVYSDASKLNVLPGTASAGKVLQSGASTTPAWSTSIYPSTAGTAGHVPRSNGTDYIDNSLAAADLSNGTTGTGAVVLASSPTLATPALGTPSAVFLTNGTGLPISTGVSGLGTGVATLLSGASSGTGGPAGKTSPTFTTPVLGAATATSINGLGITSSTGTLTVANTKTLTANSNITLSCAVDPCSPVLSSGTFVTVTASGSFSPLFVTTGTQPSCTYDNQIGNYVQTSDGYVKFSISLGTSNCSSVGSGTLQVGNLPVAVNSSQAMGGGATITGTWTTPAGYYRGAPNGTVVTLYPTNNSGTTLTAAALSTGSGANRIVISGVYEY